MCSLRTLLLLTAALHVAGIATPLRSWAQPAATPNDAAAEPDAVPGVGAFAPGGEVFAATSMVDGEPTLDLWNVANGQRESSLQLPTVMLNGSPQKLSADRIAFSPDGARLVAGNHAGFLLVWKLPATAVEEVIRLGADGDADGLHRISTLEYAPAGNPLAICFDSNPANMGSVMLLELDAKLQTGALNAEGGRPTMRFTPDGSALVTYGSVAGEVDQGKRIALWNASTSEKTRQVAIPRGTHISYPAFGFPLGFDGEGRLMFPCKTGLKGVQYRDLTSDALQVIVTIDDPRFSTESREVFSRDGTRMASLAGRRLAVFDLVEAKLIAEFEPAAAVSWLALSSNGSHVAWTDASARRVEIKLLDAAAAPKKQPKIARSEYRAWSSRDGSSQVVARLVAFKNLAVVLEDEAGKQITVPLRNFSAEDRDYALAQREKLR